MDAGEAAAVNWGVLNRGLADVVAGLLVVDWLLDGDFLLVNGALFVDGDVFVDWDLDWWGIDHNIDLLGNWYIHLRLAELGDLSFDDNWDWHFNWDLNNFFDGLLDNDWVVDDFRWGLDFLSDGIWVHDGVGDRNWGGECQGHLFSDNFIDEFSLDNWDCEGELVGDLVDGLRVLDIRNLALFDDRDGFTDNGLKWLLLNWHLLDGLVDVGDVSMSY